MSIDLESWMGSLSPDQRRSPLISIAIPGSHDSMTYSITPKSPVAPDSEKIVQRLMKYFGFIIRPIVYSWCITQSLSVIEQLALGIRYFDVRIATKEGTDDIFFVHGLYGCKVNETFEEISTFLKEHPTEVVVMDMQHFYSFAKINHENFTGVIKSIFGKMICPSQLDIRSVTLDWMREHGYQVIIIYRDKFATAIEEFWLSDDWPTPWPETMSIRNLLKFLNAKLQRRSIHRGFVSQCILTPTYVTVIKWPFSNLMKKCAVPVSKVVTPWLEEQQIGTVNVAIADFVHINSSLFPKAVVSLNFKQQEEPV